MMPKKKILKCRSTKDKTFFDLNTLTVDALEIIMHKVTIVLERRLHGELPGGEFSDLSDELFEEARPMPKSNRFDGSVFGVPNLPLYRRGATTLNVQSTIMFNKYIPRN